MTTQFEFFWNLVVAASGTAYSHPLDLDGDSVATVTITTVVGPGLSVSGTQLQASTDLTNWENLTGSFSTASAPTVTTLTFSDIGARYIRLKLVNMSGASAVFNATVTTARG